MIGSTVSHYKILERLGGGGMGIVYRARDTRLDRTVALKFLPSEWCQEPLLRERFTREARAASALDHPHICTIFDIGETNEGQLFIAMAHCPGENLKQRILRGPMPFEEAVDIAIQIAEALGAAHEGGIVHRDVKPANILITDRDQVKVVDFGLAKLAGEAAVTRQGSVVGTPAYMSPEQATGDEVDGRADLWSLGAVLYEMAVGRRAFAAENEQALLLAITTTDPTPIETLRSEVPAELQRIIRRCLKRNPEERYQNAGELVADLQRFRGDPTPAEVVTQTLPSAERFRRRWPLVLRVLSVAAVVAAVALVATLYPVLTRSPTRHILVLPFNCPGVGGDSQILCSGLLDTVTAKLAELRRFRSSLSVVPASEVRYQKIESADIARRIFGVDLVVSGSVFRENDHLRIPIELVDANRLRQIRSRTLTTEQSAEFVLQDQVITIIEEMLEIELGAGERQAMMVGGTNNAEAAELFLEARGSAGKEPTAVQLTHAMNLYRKALELDPDYADALVQLADACNQRYRLEGDNIWLEHGASYAQRAVALAPDLPAAQLAAGRLALATSAHESAIDYLQETVRLDPLRLEAYVDLADSYRAIGAADQAEQTLDRAVRTGPDNWLTYAELGRLYFERGQWEDAARYFRRVIDLAPDSNFGYTSLGGCFLFLGDWQAARKNLERAVEIGRSYPALSNLATLEYYEGNCLRASELYRQALEMDESDYKVWNNLGEADRCTGDTEGALEAYRRAAELAAARIETRPDDVGLLVDLASFYVQLGNETATRETIDRVLSLGVGEPVPAFNLAAIYEDLGDRDEALSWLERALDLGFPLHMIESYETFSDLRKDPRYVDMTRKHEPPPPETAAENSVEEGGA